MTSLTQTLTGEHRACDEQFASAESAASVGDLGTAGEDLRAFIADTERHFRREEEVLFPAFEAQTGQTMGPTQVMRAEHRQMRQLFQELEQSLAEGDQDRFLGLADTLLVLMQQHNAKEEQILYPMADRVLAGESAGIVERMAAV